ncbi:hypothetical protein PVK06_028525 [Gossypium arboreum]|uniref:Reverse transcriptase n=1 Tax=Gossypium arboreum TaxID=29729 RepID=A0ABR0P375_GOSAR|nr:hypothetical protein PVK06_028525 [Gossypium arboreum]
MAKELRCGMITGVLKACRDLLENSLEIKNLAKNPYFLVDLDHNILPTYERISSIHSGFNSTCLRCGKEKETLIHAMKDCPMARVVLTYGGLSNNFLGRDYAQCIDWIEDVFRELDKKAVADIITVLWNVWNSRNNGIFKGEEEDARMCFGLMARDSDGFVFGGQIGVMDKENLNFVQTLDSIELVLVP